MFCNTNKNEYNYLNLKCGFNQTIKIKLYTDEKNN